MTPALCVVVHDVASATREACLRLMQSVQDVAEVPVTLLAVPRYHCDPSSADFGEWLHDRSVGGDEIALHGYTHLDEGQPRGMVDHLLRRHYTRGEGEFADLPITEAMQRLTAGVRWFARHGLPLHGFVAPAWLMSLGTWEALRWLDLSYTCTLRRLVILPERRFITSQSIVYSSSSALRRSASLAWNAAVAAMQRRNPLLRLELHPHDADHPAIRRSWQKLLETHLAQRHATTLAYVAEMFRVETDWDMLGSGLTLSLDDDEHELRGQPADQRADRDVARVVQPEHHA
jgi:predicted deacetylase